MKKNTAYTIGSLIILLICAFCFVILPAFTGTETKNPNEIPPFGKYNGKEIKYEQGSDFTTFVQQYGQMYQQYGQQLDTSTYYYIFSNAFNATIMQYAYTDAVKKSGYEVPQNAINREILPYFTDENGNYSSKMYRSAPEATKQELNDSFKKSLTASRFFDDNFGSTNSFIGPNALYGLKTSSAELNFLKNYDNNKRGFNMAVFNLSNYPKEEKIAFGKENAAKFNKYDISAITVSDKSTADKVLSRINKNEITFEDAISEYSTKSYSDTEGKLTSSYQYQIENMLEDASELSTVIGLGKDAVSSVIKTKSGYTIFKNNGDMVAPDFTSDSIVNLISSYLNAYESTRIEDYFTAKAKDFTVEAMKGDFENACLSNDAEFVEIDPFPLNYGNVSLLGTLNTSSAGLSGADTNEAFLKKAFSMKLNEMSDPLVMNHSVVVIQYTIEVPASEIETSISGDELSGYDENSAQTAVLSSDKLENNFSNVYFEYMMR